MTAAETTGFELDEAEALITEKINGQYAIIIRPLSIFGTLSFLWEVYYILQNLPFPNQLFLSMYNNDYPFFPVNKFIPSKNRAPSKR